MSTLDLAVLVVTALVTATAIIGIVATLRRARGQQRLRETLARVLHEGASAEGADTSASAADETRVEPPERPRSRPPS